MRQDRYFYLGKYWFKWASSVMVHAQQLLIHILCRGQSLVLCHLNGRGMNTETVEMFQGLWSTVRRVGGIGFNDSGCHGTSSPRPSFTMGRLLLYYMLYYNNIRPNIIEWLPYGRKRILWGRKKWFCSMLNMSCIKYTFRRWDFEKN